MKGWIDNAHLFVVAKPVASRAELLVDLIEDQLGYWELALQNLVRRSMRPLPGNEAPDVSQPFAWRRSDGWAITSGDLGEGRRLSERPRHEGALEVEVAADGAVRLFCGRGSDEFEGTRVVIERLVLGLIHRVLGLAMQISRDWGYWGSWDLGVALMGTNGVAAFSLIRDDFRPMFPVDLYSQITRATLEELEATPNVVVDRLVGPFMRALGVRGSREVRALLD